MATLVAERQLNELRKKNNHVRQMLAKVQFKYTPFPVVGGILFLMFPMQPKEVQKYLGIAWVTRSPRKEEDHAGRAQKLRVPCQV